MIDILKILITARNCRFIDEKYVFKKPHHHYHKKVDDFCVIISGILVTTEQFTKGRILFENRKRLIETDNRVVFLRKTFSH